MTLAEIKVTKTFLEKIICFNHANIENYICRPVSKGNNCDLKPDMDMR